MLFLFLFVGLVYFRLDGGIELFDVGDIGAEIAFAGIGMGTEMDLATGRDNDLEVVVPMKQARSVDTFESEVFGVGFYDFPTGQFVDSGFG